jgi:N-methylhydantoinase A
VFCARGLLAADVVLRFDQSVNWSLADPDDAGRVNAATDRLVEQARAEMRAEGFRDEDVTIVRRGDFQFPGQVFQLGMTLPDAIGPADIEALSQGFFELYERTYGQGTAWEATPPIMLNVTVEARAPRPSRFELRPQASEPTAADAIVKARRRVYLPADRSEVEVPIYDDARFTPGSSVTGPGIIDATDTTILVPTGVTATRDELLNYRLQRNDP